MNPTWRWPRASREYGNFGNANQWTVNAGLHSLARETAQNSNDARTGANPADLEYTFFRLRDEALQELRDALGWGDLTAHLEAMGAVSAGAVTAAPTSSMMPSRITTVPLSMTGPAAVTILALVMA